MLSLIEELTFFLPLQAMEADGVTTAGTTAAAAARVTTAGTTAAATAGTTAAAAARVTMEVRC